MSTRARTSTAPSDALVAATARHAELLARLTEHTEAFTGAVASGSSPQSARADLVAFLRTELLPHTQLEDALLYTAVRTDKTVLLARAMQDEHRMLAALIGEVEVLPSPVDAAIAAGALAVLCEVRITQENAHLLPALESAGLDLSGLLGDRPELVAKT